MRAFTLQEGSLSVPGFAGVFRQEPDVAAADPRAAELRSIRAAQSGDRAAFGALYEQYVRLVHGILLARVPWLDVDDLVQDVFLHAMQRLPELRDPRAFAGWLAAMARNKPTDYLRRAPRLGKMPDDLAGVSEERTEALEVLGVIGRLPEAYRETLVLRLVEGMTGPEISARTGLTAASVRVNLHRGMKLLRERLKGDGPHV
jgi:RNA polymerase sigma-70 factor (ECF subfamily)